MHSITMSPRQAGPAGGSEIESMLLDHTPILSLIRALEMAEELRRKNDARSSARKRTVPWERSLLSTRKPSRAAVVRHSFLSSMPPGFDDCSHPRR